MAIRDSLNAGTQQTVDILWKQKVGWDERGTMEHIPKYTVQ